MEAPGSSAAGTETGMTVYLSYSHEDAAWKDRLLRELMPLLQRDPPTSAVYVWSDDQLAPGSRWEAEIDRVRKRASAAILLISTNYLESGYTAAQEIAQLVHLQSETGLRLLPVLVEPSEWNAIPWLRELQLLPRGAVPLSTLDPEQQEVALAQVARELHDVIARIAAQNTSSSPVIESDTDTAAPLDEADLFRSLSPSARNALEHAEGLRQATDGDGVHMEHLIAGLNQKDHGPAQRLFAAAGIEPDELRRIIETAVETDIPVIDGVYTVARLSALPPHSKHVREALIAARDVAGARGFPIVRSRHLLYGALSVEECSVIRPLLERGVRKEDILLEDTPPAAVGAAIAGFRSDEARGEDLLDITREVETLCSVLAARDVEPPVSLGLFGEWGSGKSFFMSKMEECIREITAAAQTAGNGGAAYCSNIIQIKFNAWHYIDTNLWASLASEIFEGRARAIADDKTVAVEGMDRDEARARLLAIAADSRNVLADAERRRELAETELYESEQRLERLERSEAEIQRSLGAGAILHEAYRFAVRQPEVSGKVDEAAKALNLPAAKAAATEARAQLLELHGFWGYLRGLWLAMRNQKHLPIWLLSALLFAGVVAGFTLLLTRVDPSGAARLITWGAAVVAAASAFVAPFIPPVRRAI
nr:TIR domain-containing protein [Gemmatimonadota bacterium]